MHRIFQEAVVLSALRVGQRIGVCVYKSVCGIKWWVKSSRAVDGAGVSLLGTPDSLSEFTSKILENTKYFLEIKSLSHDF